MPHIIESNIEKVTNAPVCIIIANDVKFMTVFLNCFRIIRKRVIGLPAQKTLPPKPPCATVLTSRLFNAGSARFGAGCRADQRLMRTASIKNFSPTAMARQYVVQYWPWSHEAVFERAASRF